MDATMNLLVVHLFGLAALSPVLFFAQILLQDRKLNFTVFPVNSR